MLDHAEGHPFEGEDEVDRAGKDGAPGHAVVAGGLRSLRQGQAAPLLDRLQSQGAVRAGAGEDDAHRLVLLVLGQRPEETVDR